MWKFTFEFGGLTTLPTGNSRKTNFVWLCSAVAKERMPRFRFPMTTNFANKKAAIARGPCLPVRRS
jgi:hypothetical protein